MSVWMSWRGTSTSTRSVEHNEGDNMTHIRRADGKWFDQEALISGEQFKQPSLSSELFIGKKDSKTEEWRTNLSAWGKQRAKKKKFVLPDE